MSNRTEPVAAPEVIRSVQFTQGEGTALLQLIDAAIKALGLNGAAAGAHLAKKVNDAFLEGPTGNQSSPGPQGVEGSRVDAN